MIGGLSVQLTQAFEKDFAGFPGDIQRAILGCIRDLEQEPIPAGRRVHSVSAKGKKPTIYSADVTSNKSYKLTFHIEQRVAYLRRVATHKQIDRSP